jgi:hypothetical protein
MSNYRRIPLLFTLLVACALARAEATLTMADQPLRLIRAAAVYKAINGTAVQKDDILETSGSGVQIEAGPNAIVALGPNTRVYLQNIAADGSGVDLALLQGWVKLLTKAPARGQLTTTALQLALPSGVTIVQSQGGKDAVFAEEGAQQATRFDAKGKPGTALKLASEQYTALEGDKPLSPPGRPARDFLGQMPPPFRDGLVLAPPVPKAGKIAPVKERDVDFADVADWLRATLPVKKNFVGRFKPRLADPVFRKALDQALGQSGEWKPILHPVTPQAAPNLF